MLLSSLFFLTSSPTHTHTLSPRCYSWLLGRSCHWSCWYFVVCTCVCVCGFLFYFVESSFGHFVHSFFLSHDSAIFKRMSCFKNSHECRRLAALMNIVGDFWHVCIRFLIFRFCICRVCILFFCSSHIVGYFCFVLNSWLF